MERFCSECWEHQKASFCACFVVFNCSSTLRAGFKILSLILFFRNQTMRSWLVVNNNCVPLSFPSVALSISGMLAERDWLRSCHLRWQMHPSFAVGLKAILF